MTVVLVVLIVVAVFASAEHSGRKPPRAHFVRAHTRNGKRVGASIRGRGKPLLVVQTVLLALFLTALVLRAGMTAH